MINKMSNLSFDTFRANNTDFLFTYENAGIIARGGVTTITGPSDIGRSSAAMALIAAAVNGLGFMGISANRNDLSVLWIDTEPCASIRRLKYEAVVKMAGFAKGVRPGNMVYAAAGHNAVYMNSAGLLTYLIEQHSPDLVVLDGLTDTIGNGFDSCREFSQTKDAAIAAKEIPELARRYKAAIVCCVRTSRADLGGLPKTRYCCGVIERSSAVFEVMTSGRNAVVRHVRGGDAAVPHLVFGFGRNFVLLKNGDAALPDTDNNARLK